MKQFFSIALALCLLLGMLPLQVMATETTLDPDETPLVTVAPEETVAPQPTEVPGETEAPEPTEVPSETETPEPTEVPGETEAPEPTEVPGETDPSEPPVEEPDTFISGTCGQEAVWTLDLLEGVLTISGSGIVTNFAENSPAPWSEYADYILYVIVEEGISRIGNFAFAGFEELIGVTLPEGLQAIGTYAFLDCVNLPQINLPEGLTKIAIRTFEGCTALTTVTIPETVTYIDIGAFIDCSALEYANIPSAVTTLGSSAFSGCTGLKAVNLSGALTAIESNTFYGCTSLKRIALPQGITTIGTRAFYNCTGLNHISLPERITDIGDYAFYNCTSLKSILLPDGLKTIGSYAFSRCPMEYLVIPGAVTTIGAGAFAGCTGLTQVGFLGDVPQLGEFVFNGAAPQICYPESNETWTEEAKAAFGEGLTWEAVCDTHAFTLTDALDATCTIPGYTGDMVCSECGLVRVTGVVTDALGHDIAPGTQPIHNSGRKNHNYACRRCQEGFEEECAFDDGTIIEEATMAQPGIKEYHCRLCGGTYTSAYTLESVLNRIYGDNRYQTSFEVADMMKQTLCITKFDAVIVANGMGFPDALSGSYLASVKNAPILLTNQHNLDSVKAYINENLKVGGTVYLLGGTTALPESLETGLNTFTVKRLSGANRYETNLAVLAETPVGNRDILVCTGTNFADSLSASAVNRPILLVGNVLTEDQKAFLETLNGNRLYIIGGTSAVSAALEEQLKAYGTVERIGGNDRYETSVLVAHTFVGRSSGVVLAYAQNFPDGLCGGPLAFSMGAPLILTANNRSAAAKQYVGSYRITNGMVLGGTGLISDETVANIFE